MEHCTERGVNGRNGVRDVINVCESQVEKYYYVPSSVLLCRGGARGSSLCIKYKRLYPSNHFLYENKRWKAENLNSICGSMVVFL